MRPCHLHKALVRRVGQVAVAAGSIAEGHQEAVGVAARGVLHAHVGAPLEGDDLRDLTGQGGEGFLDGAHLLGRRLGCEAEEHDVAQK